MDSWLLWQLTAGALHATDVTNASRTMLFDVHRNQWDDELLALLDVPLSLMPKVLPSGGHYGDTVAALLGAPIMIGGVAGDQQSALFGQACFHQGMAKNTYGTGCFLLMHTGGKPIASRNNLLTTIVAQPPISLPRAGEGRGAGGHMTGALLPSNAHASLPRAGEGRGGGGHMTGALLPSNAYALEGSVFVGGAVVQWLRDGLRAIQGSGEVQALAESVPDAGGVMMVPAFTGLGAPYWKPDARGMITGLTRGSTVAHIARAALESIAYQSAALLLAMSRDAVAAGAAPVSELRVDGGACVNDLLMQFQADLLGIPVVRPAVTETTALGAAYLAGLASGVYRSTDELAGLWQAQRRFLPTLPPARAADLMEHWEHAVRQATLA